MEIIDNHPCSSNRTRYNKNNDIRYDAKEEKYYLAKGKRKQSPSKKEKGKHHVAIPQEIQINKGVFEIIENYRSITNSENEEYLFHLSSQYEHLKMPNRSSFINRGKTIIHANHRTTTLMTNLNTSGFEHFTFRQKQILSYWNSDYSKEKKIDYGYCQSKNFPYECFEDDCIFCNKIHIDLSNLTTLEQSELANKITKIQDEIQIKLN